MTTTDVPGAGADDPTTAVDGARPSHRARSRRSAFWVGLLAAMLVGLAIRLWFHSFAPRALPIADGLWYHTSANLIAEGKGFIDPLSYVFLGRVRPTAAHPPLFPFLLGVVSWLGATSLAAHQYAEIAFDVLTIGAVGLLGREVGGPRLGVIAAFLAAVFPRFWAAEGGILSESLFGILIALMLLLAFRALRRSSWPLVLTLGIVIGLAALTRAEAVLFLVFLAVPVVVAARERTTTRPRLALAALAGVLVVLTPWAAWNTTRFEKPVVLSTALGALLAGANCDATYHGARIGEWTAACTDLPASRRAFAAGGLIDESVQDAGMRREGLTYIREHAGRAPFVAVVRVLRLFDLYHPHPLSYGPSWTGDAQTWGWYVLVPVAGLGVLVARRRGVSMLPFLATLLVVVLNAALTWGTARFRVPLEVSMVVLAAFTVDQGLRWVGTRIGSTATRAAPGPGGVPAA